jgi:hypothetical protein
MVSVGMLLFVGLFVLSGLGLVVVGGNGFRKWWTMRAVDPGDFRIEPGLQEFEGRAYAAEDPLTTPFTESESILCEYTVERYDHDDDGSNWDTVSSDVGSVPFEVDDGGATVAVDPAHADYLLTEEFQVDTSDVEELPPRVQGYATRNLEMGSAIELGPIAVGGRRYRFTEKRLDDGEEVYVIGPTEVGSRPAPGDSTARAVVAPGERNWRQKLLGDPFVVSDTSEEAARKRQLKRAIGLFLFGLVFAVIGIFVVVA